MGPLCFSFIRFTVVLLCLLKKDKYLIPALCSNVGKLPGHHIVHNIVDTRYTCIY